MQIAVYLSALHDTAANGMSVQLLCEGSRDEGSIWVDVAILSWWEAKITMQLDCLMRP